ncbi:hypothetical protein KUTeg_004310 [Tegillarca granosa]|uniref:Uncharacterized protein n=1 Tax=Tegillarca granosa TaxID=220873 RepID=A0ABQ9FPK0_TEGGR|nr:hypothetical protein KUTeg_004310 [Tegillarca granosa]
MGYPSQLDNLENRDTEKNNGGPSTMSSPKPTFNHNHVNGKRGGLSRPNSIPNDSLPPQHDEIVRFLTESWNKVRREMDLPPQRQTEGGPIIYRDKNPNPVLLDFKPFDLEEYWGQRTLKKTEQIGLKESRAIKKARSSTEKY